MTDLISRDKAIAICDQYQDAVAGVFGDGYPQFTQVVKSLFTSMKHDLLSMEAVDENTGDRPRN